jgi:AcrR family transcriptional regulator
MSSALPSTSTVADTAKLLWSSHSRQAGRTGLTVLDFVEAGMAIAGEEGAAALSMRSIGARLKVRSMAIYSLIPSKQALVALMVDGAYRNLYPEDGMPDVSDWRTGLRQIADAHWMLHGKHPWLLELAPSRSLMGPYEAQKTEAELRVLDRIGLTDIQMEEVLRLVLAHVAQQARAQAQLKVEQKATGLTEPEWWAELMPVLERVYDPTRFPLILRVGTEAKAARLNPLWPESTFAFGLERIFDGIEALLSKPGG